MRVIAKVCNNRKALSVAPPKLAFSRDIMIHGGS